MLRRGGHSRTKSLGQTVASSDFTDLAGARSHVTAVHDKTPFVKGSRRPLPVSILPQFFHRPFGNLVDTAGQEQPHPLRSLKLQCYLISPVCQEKNGSVRGWFELVRSLLEEMGRNFDAYLRHLTARSCLSRVNTSGEVCWRAWRSVAKLESEA